MYIQYQTPNLTCLLISEILMAPNLDAPLEFREISMAEDNCLGPARYDRSRCELQPPTTRHPDDEGLPNSRPLRNPVPQEWPLGTYTWHVL